MSKLEESLHCTAEWNVEFRRTFWKEEVNEWDILLDMLKQVQMNNDKGTVIWKLEKLGKYTTRSTRNSCC